MGSSYWQFDGDYIHGVLIPMYKKSTCTNEVHSVQKSVFEVVFLYLYPLFFVN